MLFVAPSQILYCKAVHCKAVSNINTDLRKTNKQTKALPIISMGAFFSYLVVLRVLAAQRALAILVGPLLVSLGGLASLVIQGGLDLLLGDRDQSP